MGRHAFRISNKKLAEQAREREQLARAEKKRQAELNAPLFGKPTRATKIVRPVASVPVRKTEHIPSNPDGMMGIAALPAPKVYTGDKIIGIATMHKSNLVPIFNEEAAVDVAQMRRN